MKTTFAALIALGASFAAADFIVYSSSETNYGTNGNDRGFKVFDGEPDCDDVSNTKFYMSWNDVSGKDAFRCKGSGCNHSEGDEIDELEMNFSGNSEPKIHLTYYKDREGALVGTDGEVQGSCKPAKEDDYECTSFYADTGNAVLECTYKRTAAEIQDALD